MRNLGPLLLAVLALTLAGCSSGGGGPEPGDDAPADGAMPHDPVTHEVRLRNNAFAPGDFELHVGDTVHWVTEDVQQHNVASETPEDTFRSPDMSALPVPTVYVSEFSHKFEAPGNITVVCEYHSSMVVHLTVKPHGA